MACVKDESVEIYGFQIHIGTQMIIGRQPKTCFTTRVTNMVIVNIFLKGFERIKNSKRNILNIFEYTRKG